MRRPSTAFVGAVTVLSLVLLAPSDYQHSEVDLALWLMVFPGLGAIMGFVVDLLRPSAGGSGSSPDP